MEVVWREKQCSVRDVVEHLPSRRAYTTVMTTLARLFTRGLLNRTGVDRKYIYSTRVDEVQLDYLLAQRALLCLLEIQEHSLNPELISLYIMKSLFQSNPSRFDAMVDIVRSEQKGGRANRTGKRAVARRRVRARSDRPCLE